MEGEKILIGSANTILRVLCFFFLLVLVFLGFYTHSLLDSIQTQQELALKNTETLGRLQEKVLFLEDIVINKTYEIRNLK